MTPMQFTQQKAVLLKLMLNPFIRESAMTSKRLFVSVLWLCDYIKCSRASKIIAESSSYGRKDCTNKRQDRMKLICWNEMDIERKLVFSEITLLVLFLLQAFRFLLVDGNTGEQKKITHTSTWRETFWHERVLLMLWTNVLIVMFRVILSLILSKHKHKNIIYTFFMEKFHSIFIHFIWT